MVERGVHELRQDDESAPIIGLQRDETRASSFTLRSYCVARRLASSVVVVARSFEKSG
jgi:hypothetical protein